jgi:heparin binding hemagglutinin HbhA
MPKFELPNLDLPAFELPAEVARPLYAGVGATDALVGYVRDAVADLQKRLAEVQKDVQTRISDLDLEPKTLRDQAVTVFTTQLDALSKDAQVRREAIEKLVAELQADAAGIPASVNATYADLAKRGETLVGRIRAQESTQATAAAAETTSAKAKTTKTQATKAAKKTTKSTTKKATSTAKKTSAAPKSSAKATTTSAKKTASSAARATTDGAAKVGD